MLFLPFLFLLLALLKPSSSVTYSCNSNTSCGCSTESVSITKIIGGENALINTWGWIVSLSIDDNWMCAGSILSSSWILTAAHCVEDMQPSQVLVSAASNELYGWKQWRYASAVIVHPEYDNEAMYNDIALIEISPPLNMTDPGIAKICLPISTTEDYPPINSTVGRDFYRNQVYFISNIKLVAIGWGETTEDGNVSETLQQVTVQRIAYESKTCFPFISDKSMQFCAGVPNGGKDACYGDSGGPLMIFTSSHQWVLVGIVSYGDGCARANASGVYTRVTYHLDWIYSMNVTDAITVETDNITTINTVTITISSATTVAGTSSATNKNLLSYQHKASIVLILLITFAHHFLYFTF